MRVCDQRNASVRRTGSAKAGGPPAMKRAMGVSLVSEWTRVLQTISDQAENRSFSSSRSLIHAVSASTMKRSRMKRLSRSLDLTRSDGHALYLVQVDLDPSPSLAELGSRRLRGDPVG